MQTMSTFQTLQIDGLSHWFGSVMAFENVSLTISRGECVALLGPSGSGKSTLLKAVAGLNTPVSGSLRVDGLSLDQVPAEERGFGVIFQNHALFPHMTVMENIAFGLRMRSVPRAEIVRRVDHALRLVRLEQYRHSYPHQLSGGQQQRVGLARAVVIDPPLLLMDEPLSQLDHRLRLEMRDEIRHIHRETGCALLYVTHDLEEAMSLADRVAVLINGRLREVGAPEAIYHSPSSQEVAAFLGFRNAFDARLVTGARSSGGSSLPVTIEDTLIMATAMAPLSSDDVLVMVRPADLHPLTGEGNGIAAKVESLAFQGDVYAGSASTASGTLLHFTAAIAYAVGSSIKLAADPSRMVMYDRTDKSAGSAMI